MPPDDLVSTIAAALERMRRDVRSAVEQLHKVRAECAAIREARHQSAEKHARHLKSSQRPDHRLVGTPAALKSGRWSGTREGGRHVSAALAAYARQRDDADLEVWTQEIRLRATIRIGELVRELDINDQARGGRLPTAGKPTKAAAIADAGLSSSVAYRYEELAGPRNRQAQTAGKAPAEHYFAPKTGCAPSGKRGARLCTVLAWMGILAGAPWPRPPSRPKATAI